MNKSCCICLNENEKLYCPDGCDCKSNFCKQCIIKWWSKNKNCPTCRKQYEAWVECVKCSSSKDIIKKYYACSRTGFNCKNCMNGILTVNNKKYRNFLRKFVVINSINEENPFYKSEITILKKLAKKYNPQDSKTSDIIHNVLKGLGRKIDSKLGLKLLKMSSNWQDTSKHNVICPYILDYWNIREENGFSSTCYCYWGQELAPTSKEFKIKNNIIFTNKIKYLSGIGTY